MTFDDTLSRRPARAPREPVTARVVRADPSADGGARWVVPLGADQRHPIGPCRGGAGVPVGAVVLLVWTDERPWIAAWEA